MRVLVADDEEKVRSALILLLKEQFPDCTLYEAESVAQVLEITKEQPLDLILLDWELGKHGGHRAISGLRALYRPFTIIVLSGRPEARQAALQAGADDFVSKGHPPECLLKAIFRQTFVPYTSGPLNMSEENFEALYDAVEHAIAQNISL